MNAEFDIDVSGEDMFSKDYTICVADRDGLIRGFKFSSELINIITSRYGQGIYNRYKKSQKGKASLKIRLYSLVIYYIFNSLRMRKKKIILNICRDFNGREHDIKTNLSFFLEEKLCLKIEKFDFCKLRKNSHAHEYSYLMKKDAKNQLKTYVKISIEELEEFLKK